MLAENRTDAEIIASSLHEPSLFGEIFMRHRVAIYRFLAQRVGAQDAEDLVTVLFIKAFDARSRFRPDRSDSLPWLYGIATNVIGEHIRRHRSRVFLHPIDLAVGMADASEPAPEDEVLRTELSRTLNTALGSLSESGRNALLLHELEGLSYDQISVALGIPANTVGTRIHRAKRKLALILGEDADLADRVPKVGGNLEGQ